MASKMILTALACTILAANIWEITSETMPGGNYDWSNISVEYQNLALKLIKVWTLDQIENKKCYDYDLNFDQINGTGKDVAGVRTISMTFHSDVTLKCNGNCNPCLPGNRSTDCSVDISIAPDNTTSFLNNVEPRCL